MTAAVADHDSQLHTVVCDGYDREVLARILRRDRALTDLQQRLARLLPHAGPLLCDLFCALFKMNVVSRPEGELSAAVLINRRIVQSVVKNRDLAELRKRTELRESECAAALPSLVERIMRALGREFRYLPERLMATAEVAHDERELAERKAELEHLQKLPPEAFEDGQSEQTEDEQSELGDDTDDDHLEDADDRDDRADAKAKNAREKLAAELTDEIDGLERRIAKVRAEQARTADRLASELDDSVGLKIALLPKQMDEADEQLSNLSLGRGDGGHVDAGRRLQLGERLLRSRKLQLLAKLVGAFREVANEARRKRVARSPQELHAISSGAQLERILPSELFGLPRRRGLLHKEFLRRLAEGQLLQYELHGASARGPIVVCVDGSGSMRGAKELWAKAVALTLMDIARREKRRCLAIVFSSSHEIFQVELLASGASRALQGSVRARVLDQNVLDFAEYFPGGGTDFEEPLRRAMDAVGTGNYRRGDIVFITDGHAHVSADLLDELDRRRRKHRFRVRGILVDVVDSSTRTLQGFCDDVRLVSDLVADPLSDLFASI